MTVNCASNSCCCCCFKLSLITVRLHKHHTHTNRLLLTRDALIGIGAPNNRLIPINGKKLILLSYLSYLFRLRLLSEDSYLLEGLQSADKTKTYPKAKLQNTPTFTGNGSHCDVCLLLVIKIKTCTYQLCK